MSKYTTNQKLKVSHKINVEIVGFDTFGRVDHYGVIYHINEVGQPTKMNAGWIPAELIDAMDVIEVETLPTFGYQY